MERSPMSTTKSSGLRLDRAAKTQSSYDALAEEYARHISNELDHRPRERDLLRRFAQQSRNHGVICDLGCGPGHIARYIHDFNADVIGFDFSRAHPLHARPHSPDALFLEHSITAPPFPARPP